MKYLKRIGVIFLALLFLLLASAFVLITFYKKEMVAVLTDKLKEKYNLTLQCKDIDVSLFNNFPQLSVELKQIYLLNDIFENKNEPLLKAGSLSLSFNLKKLLQQQFIVKSVAIKDAEINLLRERDGRRNFEIHQKADTTQQAPSNFKFEVSNIHIRKTTFKFRNLEREQNISIQFLDNTVKLKHYADAVSLDISGKTLVNQLVFNAQQGAFLKNARLHLNLKADYFKDTKTICISPPSLVEIENQNYGIASLINLGEEKKLALYVSGKNMRCEKTARLLSPKLQKMLSNFDVRTPIDANILLVTHIGRREEPVIIANIEAKNSDLTIGNTKVPYSDLSFKGKIVSLDKSRQQGDAENAKIVFSPVSGKLYDFPFTASVSVTNFKQPYINIRGHLFIDAAKIQSKKEFVLKGSCSADIQYSGLCNKLNKQDFLSESMTLNANLNFKDLSFRMVNTPYNYVVNGNANIDNSNLTFENLLLKTNGGKVTLKGKARDFTPYALNLNKGFKADLTAYTDNFSLNPYLLNTENESKAKTKPKANKKTKSENVFEFNVSLFAKKLLVRKVDARNADVKLNYKTNLLTLKSFKVDACDGKISGRADLQHFNKLNAQVSVQEVNVTKLFQQFENFGQAAISDKNLKGTIFIDADLEADLDNNMEIIAESMNGAVELKLKEGHLINYEPLQKVSRFVFKNRNFEDITFSELNENFKIKGYRMDIDELEIASNVLNLYVVNGYFNFNGNSNLNLLIPWNNLKPRDRDYIPKSSGQDVHNVKGVKLNVSGANEKMKVSFGHK